MASANSRIDIRVGNPEKDAWMKVAEEKGVTLTQLIKQAVRIHVQDWNSNSPRVTTSGSTYVWEGDARNEEI